MAKNVLTVSHHVDFPAEAVFDAWTNRRDVEGWLSCGEAGTLLRIDSWDAQKGGRISVWITHADIGPIEITGEFIRIETSSHLSYYWGPAGDIVTVDLTRTETGTQIIVQQTLDDDSPMNPIVKSGWQKNLDDITRFLTAAKAAASTTT